MEKISFIAFAATLALCLTGCTKSNQEAEKGTLSLGFSMPEKELSGTRSDIAGAVPDTNTFILKITGGSGDILYSGPYGERPQRMTLESGSYYIDVVSCDDEAPAFGRPLYGDHQIAIVKGGSSTNVRLLCKLVSSGIKLKFTTNFRKRFTAGYLTLSQDAGNLIYDFDENRTGYFKSGNVVFTAGEKERLLNKVVQGGTIYNLTLDCPYDESDAGFSIEVDSSGTDVDETIIIGNETIKGADGSSREKALDVATASGRPGDTLWVWGYIVGGDLTTSGISFTPPFTKSSNLAIAGLPGERTRENCFPVEISKTSVKEALNLCDHPDNLGKKVFLYGIVSNYFSLPGLKKVTEFVFDGNN